MIYRTETPIIGYDITEITEDMDYPKIDYETLNNAK